MSRISEFRSVRIFDIALFDLILAIIGTIIVFFLINKMFRLSFSKRKIITAGVLLTIPIGIVFHYLFSINTTLNYKLGLSKSR